MSRAWTGKAALHIQPHWTGRGSLEALVAVISRTWSQHSGSGRQQRPVTTWMGTMCSPEHTLHHLGDCIYCLILNMHSAWTYLFFQQHSFRLDLNKRTSEGKSCPLSSWLKPSDNVSWNVLNAKTLDRCSRPIMGFGLSGAPKQSTDFSGSFLDYRLPWKELTIIFLQQGCSPAKYLQAGRNEYPPGYRSMGASENLSCRWRASSNRGLFWWKMSS